MYLVLLRLGQNNDESVYDWSGIIITHIGILCEMRYITELLLLLMLDGEVHAPVQI